MPALTNELLAYMKTFDQVIADGTVAQKRLFIRAFVQQIDIDPSTRKRRIRMPKLPLTASASAPLYLGRQ